MQYPDQTPPPQQPYPQQPLGMPSPTSRVTYIVLALFLGGWGIHNFVAGYKDKAIKQLIFGILTCCIVSGIWAIIDICTVTTDAEGRTFS